MSLSYLNELRQLRHEPELRLDEQGCWSVRLGSGWKRVYELREELVRPENEDVLRQLEKHRVPLGWLALPDFDPVTQQRLRGTRRFEETLERMEAQAHALALGLAEQLLDLAEEKRLELPTTVAAHLAKHVLPALNGVVVAVEMDLPWELREQPEALFRIERTGTQILGRWVGGATPALDLRGLLVHQAATAGGLPQRTATELAQLVLGALFESDAGQTVLPGLPVKERADDAIILVWRKRSRRALYEGLSGPASRGME
jgi:hypothetical protein